MEHRCLSQWQPMVINSAWVKSFPYIRIQHKIDNSKKLVGSAAPVTAPRV